MTSSSSCVYVGRFDPLVSHARFTAWCEQVAPVIAVRHLPDAHGRIYAFCYYAQPTDAKKAVRLLNGSTIDGVRVKVGFEDRRTRDRDLDLQRMRAYRDILKRERDAYYATIASPSPCPGPLDIDAFLRSLTKQSTL